LTAVAASLALAVALAPFLAVASATCAGEEPAAIIPDFLLESAGGERVSLHAERTGRALTVLAFLVPGDPASAACVEAVAQCEREFADRGVVFLAVACRARDVGAVAALAREADAGFPVLLDPYGAAAQRAGVARAATVLVLDPDFRAVYRGAADDRFEGGPPRSHASNDYLLDAIESALAGETIDPAETEAAGAPIEPADARGRPLTFHGDVAPILWTHCVECHRPGQIGPMSFLDADEATGWAPQIAEVVTEGRMPPWHASARHGRFRNERRLTETEKRTLELWAATGAKAGDPKDAPPPPVFADPDWKIGRPDLVLDLPEEQPIPAEGVVPYRYVPLDPGFTEDFWVQAVEVRPTSRAATHHVIAYLLPPGMSPRDALRSPEGVLSLDGLGGYAPGSDPMDLPDGEGVRVAKGSTLLFELHYTPVGKATSDRTRVAVRFSRVPVKRVIETGAAMNFGFRIPPRRPDATFQARHRFRAPAEILTLTPHMHMRGRSFRYELERGDGTRQVLLDVPRYDFNWQHTYVLREPVRAAAGDVLRVTAVFDNSKDNPFNPNPDVWVTWGEQTFEEMLIGYFDYVETRPAKE
jgi:hypothetical protein